MCIFYHLPFLLLTGYYILSSTVCQSLLATPGLKSGSGDGVLVKSVGQSELAGSLCCIFLNIPVDASNWTKADIFVMQGSDNNDFIFSESVASTFGSRCRSMFS